MPNPAAMIELARAEAELYSLTRKHRFELHRKLDEVLEKLDDLQGKPDCRFCKHFAPARESCEHANACIEGSRFDAFFVGCSVRLYQREAKP